MQGSRREFIVAFPGGFETMSAVAVLSLMLLGLASWEPPLGLLL